MKSKCAFFTHVAGLVTLQSHYFLLFTLPFKVLGLEDFLMSLKEVSFAQQGCIYMVKIQKNSNVVSKYYSNFK